MIGKTRPWISLACSLAFMFFAAQGVAAQDEGARNGFVNVTINEDLSVAASVYLDAPPSDPEAIEAALATSLGGSLTNLQTVRDDEADLESSWAAILATADGALVHDAGQRRLTLETAPLVAALRAEGIGDVHVVITHPSEGRSACPGALEFPVPGSRLVGYSYIVRAGADAPVLELAFGYSRTDAARWLGLAAGALAVPALYVAVRRRRALAGAERDRARAWFNFARSTQLAMLAVWFGWLGFAVTHGVADAADMVAALLGTNALPDVSWAREGFSTAPAASIGWLLAPPAAVAIVISAISGSVDRRVRGTAWRSRDVAGQALLGQAATLAPLGSLAIGVVYLFLFDFSRAFVWIALGLVSLLVLAPLLARSLDFAAYEVTAGELRDRIFQLADAAGIRVRHLFAIPSTRGRLANAFAVRGDKVMLSSPLVERLSRRETDAVVLHELAHLELGHPTRLALALLGVVLMPSLVAVAVHVTTALPWFAVWAVATIGALVAYFALRRAYEFAADARAIEVSRDPEALVAALAEVMRANVMPLRFGRFEELLLSHPSTMRRFEAIAERGGLAPGRVEELLGGSGHGEASYPLPAVVGSEEWLFSGRFRQAIRARIGWIMTANVVLTPIAVALVGARVDAPPWLLFAVAALAGFGLMILLSDVLPLRGYDALEHGLAAKLERDGVRVDSRERTFVGFSPGDTPRVYDGFFDWDVGFVAIGDGLSFAGEQARFTLRRDQVLDVRLVAGAPGWWHTEAVAILWATDAASGALLLKPVGVRRIRRIGPASRRLHAAIVAWRDGGSHSGDVPDFGPPAIGEVTSVSPRSVATPQAILTSALLAGFLSLGVGQLAGLALSSTAIVALAATILLALLQFLPFLSHRST